MRQWGRGRAVAAVLTDVGLSSCGAIAIAQDDRGSSALLALGRRVGFGTVVDYSQLAEVDPKLLPFFLMHYGIGDAAKSHLIKKLRSSASAVLRFAPIVLFMPDGPVDEMIQFIEMGFDDVICLPEKSDVLAARLAGQIGQERVFIETPDYLGPDRRRMDLATHENPKRRPGGSSHTRLTIIRQPGSGVEIVGTQMIMAKKSEARTIDRAWQSYAK